MFKQHNIFFNLTDGILAWDAYLLKLMMIQRFGQIYNIRQTRQEHLEQQAMQKCFILIQCIQKNQKTKDAKPISNHVYYILMSQVIRTIT